MEKRRVGRPKQEVIKDRQVTFRVNEKDFEALEKMSEVSGAGTAHNFVRVLAERVINRAGAVDAWGKNEADQK